MEPVFQTPDSERDKPPRKKSWVTAANKYLQLSTYIWEATASTHQLWKGQWWQFLKHSHDQDTCRCPL